METKRKGKEIAQEKLHLTESQIKMRNSHVITEMPGTGMEMSVIQLQK